MNKKKRHIVRNLLKICQWQNLYLFGNIATLSVLIINWEEYFMLHHHNQNFFTTNTKQTFERTLLKGRSHHSSEMPRSKQENLRHSWAGSGGWGSFWRTQSNISSFPYLVLTWATSELPRMQSWRLGHSFLQSALPHQPWSGQEGHQSLSCCHWEAQLFSHLLSSQQLPDKSNIKHLEGAERIPGGYYWKHVKSSKPSLWCLQRARPCP